MTTRCLPSLAKPAGWLPRFLRDESGTTATEYGIVTTLIGITAVASLGILGDELNSVLCGIRMQVNTMATCP